MRGVLGFLHFSMIPTTTTAAAAASISLNSFPSISRLFSSQIDILTNPLDSTAQISWPSCSTAQYYRVNSLILDTNSNSGDSMNHRFKLFSAVEPQIKLNNFNSEQTHELTITPINTKGDEILEHKLSKTFLGNVKKEISPSTTNSELSHLEIKVGKILDVKVHPDADSLYIETVDVGESQPRTIVSGLVKYCTKEELLNRYVIVLCNLKPRSLKGVVSHGMLLCASNSDHTEVDPLSPPSPSNQTIRIGENIQFEGYLPPSVMPSPSNRVNKAFEKVVNDLVTTAEGVATYRGKIPFMTSLGPCYSRIKQGKIS